MEKFIHYCWFGGKPLPKLAKKCIKSWKKYLPDFEIIEWNESNVDINECPFIKEAYEEKKWAFVADYARTKAIEAMGGIYFDTDMILTKNINFLLENDTFLGLEDSMMVNAAVWGAKEPHSYLAKRILDFYQSCDHFSSEDIFQISIPRILTRMLDELGLDPTSREVQKLEHGIYIYPREYFYPLSYDFNDNEFTDNTCMIHYFDATWIDSGAQREIKFVRRFGKKNGYRILRVLRFGKKLTIKGIKALLLPRTLYKRYRYHYPKKYFECIDLAIEDINNAKEDYVILHNPEWLGVTNATIELFSSRVRCGELKRKKDVKRVKEAILKKGLKQVIFSAMCIGWKDLAIELKKANPSIKIKVFWHGNHSQVSEPYGWKRNIEIFDLNREGIIDVIATCKKSILEFYKKIGIKTCFITNKVTLLKRVVGKPPKDEVRIGIYAAKCDDWRKNMFTSLVAAKLIPNAVVDMVPLSPEAKRVASSLGIKLDGLEKPLPREEIFKRMSNNTINLYVTFSECSPMLPLESFEAGVPCIFGNNHHCFEGNKLKEYLLVNNEESPVLIAEKVNECLKNKDKIMKLYNNWKIENNKESAKEVKDFLKM